MAKSETRPDTGPAAYRARYVMFLFIMVKREWRRRSESGG